MEDRRKGTQAILASLGALAMNALTVVGGLAGATVDLPQAVPVWLDRLRPLGELLRGPIPASAYYGILLFLFAFSVYALLRIGSTHRALPDDNSVVEPPEAAPSGVSSERSLARVPTEAQPDESAAPLNELRIRAKEPSNPYNSSLPGNLFTGYEKELRQLRQGLRNGKSYAILGGRRCGKTSLLLELKKEIESEGLEDYEVLPRFLDFQGEIPHSISGFWRTLANLVAGDIQVEPWRGAEGGTQPYQEFLRYLDSLKPRFGELYGTSWLTVLLIDELDVAVSALSDAECLHNLRSLLQTSGYRRHFRVVASGVTGLSDLIQSGSPFNNILDPFSLRRLDEGEARRLVSVGFGSSLPLTLEAALLQQTGGHPYMLQGVLEILWEKREALDEATLHSAVSQFVRKREDLFQHWLKMIKAPGMATYHVLARPVGEPPSAAELRRLVPPGRSVGQILNALAYHGLIDDSDGNRPRTAGTIFRDWFRENYGPQMEGTSGKIGF